MMSFDQTRPARKINASGNQLTQKLAEALQADRSWRHQGDMLLL